MAEDDRRDRAGRDAVRNEVLHGGGAVWRWRQHARVDLFQQPFVARALRVGDFHVDDVPARILRFDLSFDLGDAARIVDRVDLCAGLGLPRLVIGLDLAFRVSAAPRHDDERLARERARGHGRERDPRMTEQQLDEDLARVTGRANDADFHKGKRLELNFETANERQRSNEPRPF